MHRTSALLLPLLLLALGACVSAPPIEIASSGIAPAGAAHFSIVETEDPQSPEADAASAVSTALAARGWVAGGERQGWRVEVAYVERPSAVGGFTEESEPAESGLWRAPPHARRWWRRHEARRSLSLRILDKSTGQEVVRSSAVQRMTDEPLPLVLERLASAAVAEALQPPVADSDDSRVQAR
jgi:hypothetical protein